MTYAASILADSLSPAGVRLTTVLATYPAIAHEHMLTHRVLSRSTSSIRAIPTMMLIEDTRRDPFIPAEFRRNRPGMQPGEVMTGEDHEWARVEWIRAARNACDRAEGLARRGVHKEHAGRLLGPFLWRTVIITATEWANLFNLRTDGDAQVEIRTIVGMIRDAMVANTPRPVAMGDWHLPMVGDGEHADPSTDWARVSAGRCARVSYRRHLIHREPGEDVALARTLVERGHMGPLEHVATPIGGDRTVRDALAFHGNLRGWVQLRKMIPGEAVFRGTG